tara:strand:+ start:1668 stop:2441 length:774 start_codon:yes stop_codon:yes gene_type:complete
MSKTITVKTVGEVVTITSEGGVIEVGKGPNHSILTTANSEYVGILLAIAKVNESLVHPVNDTITIEDVLFVGDKYELADALALSLITSDSGSGTDVSVHHGFVDYNDASTGITPLTLASDVWTDVPNDGLGTFTNLSYIPTGMTKLMNTADGSLDFSELTLGSDVLIRIDLDVTPNTNNALMSVRYNLGAGGGSYPLPVSTKRLDSGSGIPYASGKGSFYIYMGDSNTRDNPGILQVKVSSGGTLVNNGVAIKIFKL